MCVCVLRCKLKQLIHTPALRDTRIASRRHIRAPLMTCAKRTIDYLHNGPAPRPNMCIGAWMLYHRCGARSSVVLSVCVSWGVCVCRVLCMLDCICIYTKPPRITNRTQRPSGLSNADKPKSEATSVASRPADKIVDTISSRTILMSHACMFLPWVLRNCRRLRASNV